MKFSKTLLSVYSSYSREELLLKLEEAKKNHIGWIEENKAYWDRKRLINYWRVKVKVITYFLREDIAPLAEVLREKNKRLYKLELEKRELKEKKEGIKYFSKGEKK